MIKRICFAAIVTLMMSSCGWQLRGLNGGADSFLSDKRPEKLRLVFQDRKSKLVQPIQQQMARLKIERSTDADTILVVEKEQVDKRPLAVTDTGVTAQYQLMYTVHYHYETQKGADIHSSRKIVSWRTYDFDAQLIVAKAQEELALLEEMRDELAQRILSTSI